MSISTSLASSDQLLRPKAKPGLNPATGGIARLFPSGDNLGGVLKLCFGGSFLARNEEESSCKYKEQEDEEFI